MCTWLLLQIWNDDFIRLLYYALVVAVALLAMQRWRLVGRGDLPGMVQRLHLPLWLWLRLLLWLPLDISKGSRCFPSSLSLCWELLIGCCCVGAS